MELVSTEGGDPAATGTIEEESGEIFAGPIENPTIEPLPHDPLLEPHPHEPGVKGDGGGGAPPENPGRRRSR